jgi:hypothetical protein
MMLGTWHRPLSSLPLVANDPENRNLIAKLMVTVGVVALNTAAARAFMEWEWTGLFLIGLALQVGLVCLIRSRIGFR